MTWRDRPCLDWHGKPDKNGYGRSSMDGKQIRAHVKAFLLAGGELTSDRPQVNHYCHRRICVESTHLYAGTQAENMQDMVEAGHAHNANKTHCPDCGEPYTHSNAAGRVCLPCHARRMRQARAAKSA